MPDKGAGKLSVWFRGPQNLDYQASLAPHVVEIYRGPRFTEAAVSSGVPRASPQQAYSSAAQRGRGSGSTIRPSALQT